MKTMVDKSKTRTNYEFNSLGEKVNKLEEIEPPMAAVERHLESRNKRSPIKNSDFFLKVCELLDDREFAELLRQHKYAGRQTVNYFIITGISEFELEDIDERICNRLPEKHDVHEVPKEPFIAESERIGQRLYLAIGYYENAGSEDPVTGRREDVLITKRTVVVVQDDSDLIEIRGSDVNRVEDIRDKLCRSIGKYRDSVKERPNMGHEFQKEFNDLVGLYYNLKVRVDDQEDTTLDTISFTSKEDKSGNRKDAREDDRVEKELSERGGEITMGYVELDEGFRFRLNRDSSKLSFMKFEREENLNQITNLIDNVLKQTGAYSQGTISGVKDVPE